MLDFSDFTDSELESLRSLVDRTSLKDPAIMAEVVATLFKHLVLREVGKRKKAAEEEAAKEKA